MSDYYELAQAFTTNPDPNFAGCLNTGKEEPGVVFPGIEPAEASYCYVGRSSLYEAVAALNDIPVKRVVQLLGGDKKSKDRITLLEAEVAELSEKLDKFEAFSAAAEEAGLFVQGLE
jgi:hypothetical protein